MILITGGSGFIGLHTARALIDAGEQVVATRYSRAREPDFIKNETGKNFFVEQADVAAPGVLTEIARKYKCDGIIHLVAPAYRALSASEDYRVNMLGLVNVLQAAEETKMRRVSIGSSLAVYNMEPKGPFLESMRLVQHANEATGAYKKAWEVLSQHYGDRVGLDVICLRIASISGPLYHSMANLQSRMVHPAVKGEPGPIVRNEAQKPYEEDAHEFLYVKDAAAGISALQLAGKLNHRVYNVSSGRATTAAEFAAAVRKAVPGAEIRLEPGRGPGWKDNPSSSIDRAAADVGYRPQYDTERAVADYVAWLRAGNEF